MKLKTSIAILTGCLTIFLFLMLPVFLSMKEKKDQTVAAFKGSDFELKDMNNNSINQNSFDVAFVFGKRYSEFSEFFNEKYFKLTLSLISNNDWFIREKE